MCAIVVSSKSAKLERQTGKIFPALPLTLSACFLCSFPMHRPPQAPWFCFQPKDLEMALMHFPCKHAQRGYMGGIHDAVRKGNWVKEAILQWGFDVPPPAVQQWAARSSILCWEAGSAEKHTTPSQIQSPQTGRGGAVLPHPHPHTLPLQLELITISESSADCGVVYVVSSVHKHIIECCVPGAILGNTKKTVTTLVKIIHFLWADPCLLPQPIPEDPTDIQLGRITCIALNSMLFLASVYSHSWTSLLPLSLTTSQTWGLTSSKFLSPKPPWNTLQCSLVFRIYYNLSKGRDRLLVHRVHILLKT